MKMKDLTESHFARFVYYSLSNYDWIVEQKDFIN